MDIYDSMRQFADSWGLLAMFGVFVIAVVYAFRPGSGEAARRAANIPFEDDAPESPNGHNGGGSCRRVQDFRGEKPHG